MIYILKRKLGLAHFLLKIKIYFLLELIYIARLFKLQRRKEERRKTKYGRKRRRDEKRNSTITENVRYSTEST